MISWAPQARAAWLWSPDAGKWSNVKDLPRDTPEEQFEAGKIQYEQDNFDGALGEFEKVTKHFTHTRWAAEAQFYKGLCFEKKKDIGKAAEAFKTLVDRYPYSERLNDAIEHEYELAEAMLDGKKTKFLGMAIMPAQDIAVDLYRHIVRNAPFGPFGAVSQFRLGDAEMAVGNAEEAERAYQAVIDDYPSSEYAAKAKYKIAQVSFESAVEQEHHDIKTDEAINRLEGFKTAYPSSELQSQADQAIRVLRGKKAADLYTVASFYEARGRHRGAKMYYEDIVRVFPETEHAQLAKTRVDAYEKAEAAGQDLSAASGGKKFLGVIPMGSAAEGSQTPAAGGAKPAPRRFLGLIPMGSGETKAAEPKSDRPAPKKFLGFIPIGSSKQTEGKA